jgi:hypothetical protein
MVVAGCGDKTNEFELDITVTAPAAAGALVDGNVQIPATGGVYARPYGSAGDAATVTGTVQTLDAMGGVRASASYAFGTYCAAVTPLTRQNERFVETTDTLVPVLALDSVECLRPDGTGSVIRP